MEYKQTYIKIGKHVFQDTSIHRKLKKKIKKVEKNLTDYVYFTSL